MNIKDKSICYINSEREYTKLKDINFDIDNNYFDDDLDFVFERLYGKMTSTPLKLPITEEIIGPKIFFRGILTDFMVKDVISNNTEFLLIDIINRIMKKLLNKYYEKTKVRVKFIYRGGNILNIYKKNFDFLIPGIASLISEQFDEFFKKSDLDFYLIVGGRDKYTINQLNLINAEIQSLSYYGLVIARDLIYSNDIFKMCNYNLDSIKDKFDDLLNEMNENKGKSSFNFVKNLNYIGLGFNKFYYVKEEYDINPMYISEDKLDFVFDSGNRNVYDNFRKRKKSGHFDTIINISKEEGVVNIYKLRNLEKNIFFRNERFDLLTKKIMENNKDYPDYYITNNLDIHNVEGQMHFKLSRIMVNFNLLYQTNKGYGMVNVPSELYDVSVSYHDDRVMPFYNLNSISKFDYEYKDADDNLIKNDIPIPKLSTTIKDLDKILYFVGFPWDDEKYQKRLIRILILIFINEFTEKNINQIEKILDNVLNNKEMKKTDKIDFAYIQYMNKQIGERINKDTKKKYNKYIETINETVTKMKKIIKEIKLYIKNKGLIKDQKLLKIIL